MLGRVHGVSSHVIRLKKAREFGNAKDSDVRVRLVAVTSGC